MCSMTFASVVAKIAWFLPGNGVLTTNYCQIGVVQIYAAVDHPNLHLRSRIVRRVPVKVTQTVGESYVDWQQAQLVTTFDRDIFFQKSPEVPGWIDVESIQLFTHGS